MGDSSFTWWNLKPRSRLLIFDTCMEVQGFGGEVLNSKRVNNGGVSLIWSILSLAEVVPFIWVPIPTCIGLLRDSLKFQGPGTLGALWEIPRTKHEHPCFLGSHPRVGLEFAKISFSSNMADMSGRFLS